MNGRTHEIKGADLLNLLRARADRLARQLYRAPVRDYVEDVTCLRHPQNGGNCRFHALPGNCDSGLCDVVFAGELPPGGDG